ncbi:MAG: hypothetical protein NC218_12370 [Acetobacter sp.]|nr:hypothetical protein [Acetobacter sp.]
MIASPVYGLVAASPATIRAALGAGDPLTQGAGVGHPERDDIEKWGAPLTWAAAQIA